LAESNPDMFGASIAFKMGEIHKKLETVDGQQMEKNYATILNLFAADLVDDPAATDGLFDTFHEDDFAFQVSVFLDEHPEIFALLDQKPEILKDFLSNYKQYKSRKSMNFKTEIENLKKWVSDNFSSKKSDPALVQLRADFDSKILALEAKMADLSPSPSGEGPGEAASPSPLGEGWGEALLEFDTLSKSFISTHQLDIDLPDEVPSADFINAFFVKADSLIQFKNNEILRLTTELNKSKAFPSVPDKNGDPKLNIHKKTSADNSGKILLEHIPDTIKRKLKSK